MRLEQIQIRDPFILTDETDASYYLYGSTDADIWNPPGTGFDYYRSTDLIEWDGPYPAWRPPADFWSPGQYWAPEVHRYMGRYFLFATFGLAPVTRGTQIFVAESPSGPFELWSNGPVTPSRWSCLDGTLFVDELADPWVVFCHEWLQVRDGAMYAQRLSSDLKSAVGTPVFLFSASEAMWSTPMRDPRPGHSAFPIFVTDGPSLYRLTSGELIMLWSGSGKKGYTMGIAQSVTGLVTGPWVQQEDPLWEEDGGHGMIVRLLDGTLAMTLHQPNRTPDERAVISVLREGRRSVEIDGRIT